MFGNVLLKSPGHVVPDAAIEAVLKGYNAAVGIARAMGDGSIEINHGGSEFAEHCFVFSNLSFFLVFPVYRTRSLHQTLDVCLFE